MQKTVCSVFFDAVNVARSFKPMPPEAGGYRTAFHIPAQAKGEYGSLLVKDMLKRDYLVEGRYSETPEPGENIAADIVSEVSTNFGAGGGAGGGVWVVSDRLAAWLADHPTGKVADVPDWARAEVTGQLAKQTRLCEFWRKQAEDFWTNGKKLEVTANDNYRKASRYLGFNEDPWLITQAIDAPERIKCPFCRGVIEADSIICFHCKQIVNQAAYDKRVKPAPMPVPEPVMAAARPIAPPLSNPRK